jgi:hypothetical protein
MNERIVLLKHQASVWCDENIPDQFSEETNGYGRAWEEKFAELIVRECMEQVWYTRDDVVNGNISEVIKERMKQHFGVEE